MVLKQAHQRRQRIFLQPALWLKSKSVALRLNLTFDLIELNNTPPAGNLRVALFIGCMDSVRGSTGLTMRKGDDCREVTPATLMTVIAANLPSSW